MELVPATCGLHNLPCTGKLYSLGIKDAISTFDAKCIAISTSAIQTKTKYRRNTQYSENPTDIHQIRFQRPRNPRMIQARNQAIDTDNATR